MAHLLSGEVLGERLVDEVPVPADGVAIGDKPGARNELLGPQRPFLYAHQELPQAQPRDVHAPRDGARI